MFQKASNSLIRYAFDNAFIKKALLKQIPNQFIQVQTDLGSWDELFILFQSPFLRAQTLIEEKGLEYLAAHDP